MAGRRRQSGAFLLEFVFSILIFWLILSAFVDVVRMVISLNVAREIQYASARRASICDPFAATEDGAKSDFYPLMGIASQLAVGGADWLTFTYAPSTPANCADDDSCEVASVAFNDVAFSTFFLSSNLLASFSQSTPTLSFSNSKKITVLREAGYTKMFCP